MEQYEDTMRGIPLWLLQEYLQELGGIVQTDGSLKGDGWQAHLEQVEDYLIGSLRIGQVHIILSAEPVVMIKLKPALEKRLFRAGG